jgi:hypothetical protein
MDRGEPRQAGGVGTDGLTARAFQWGCGTLIAAAAHLRRPACRRTHLASLQHDGVSATRVVECSSTTRQKLTD